jgi:hypothetical protein
MHLSLAALTMLAVFIHLGTSLASSFLKDNTDRKKLAAIDAKTDQVLGVVSAIAPAVPATAPKTISQIASDLAAVSAALATATGGTSHAG